MTIDFGDAKKIIDGILPDHQYLNEVYDFNPTAENLVKYFKKELIKMLPVDKVRVWESATSAAET
jgi:6-pyruvoyltetrahydropterin/6-carboxytetrahydropterin synthase